MSQFIEFIKSIKYIIIYIVIINISMIFIVSANSRDIIINNEEKLLESEKPWELFEGYNLTVTIIDRDRVLVSLSKSGDQIPVKGVYKDSPYRYIDNKTGKEILYFYVQDINNNKIKILHVYQYSNGEFSPTPIVTTISSLTLIAKEKTLIKDENWNIGNGWKLKAQTIDTEAKQVKLEIYNNEIKLNEAILSEGDIYNYNNIFITQIKYIYFQWNTEFVHLSDTKIDTKSIPIFSPKPLQTQVQTEPSTYNLKYMTEAIKDNLHFIIVFMLLVIFFNIYKNIKNRSVEINLLSSQKISGDNKRNIRKRPLAQYINIINKHSTEKKCFLCKCEINYKNLSEHGIIHCSCRNSNIKYYHIDCCIEQNIKQCDCGRKLEYAYHL